MSNETITIPVEGREALVAHIEDLQAVITKRNELIEALEKENEELLNSPSEFLERLRDEAWRKGWNTCKKTIKDSMGRVENFLDQPDL